jgi:hypothetical protein
MTLLGGFRLFNGNACRHSRAMSDEIEPPITLITKQELETRLDQFGEMIEAAESPEKVIEWLDEEAGDLLDGLWGACGEKLAENEWDALFAILPRIYSVMIPEGLERLEIDADRLAGAFENRIAAKAVLPSRQPEVVQDALSVLDEISEQESVLNGPSKRIATALLTAAIDELDVTVWESVEEDGETQS